jgi:hypothetical protein
MSQKYRQNISSQIIPIWQKYAFYYLKNIPKEINILTVKIKLKRKRLEEYLECQINAQKDKEG